MPGWTIDVLGPRRRTIIGRRSSGGSRDSRGAPSVVSVVVRLTPRATLTRLPSCSTSISVRPVSSSRSASSRISCLSKEAGLVPAAGVFVLGHQLGLLPAIRPCERLDGQFVAVCSEPADHALHGLGDIRMVAKRLARENVRQMHLDGRNGAGEQSVQHGDRRMGEGAGVDDQPCSLGPCLLDPGHELALMVALAEVYRKSKRFGLRLAFRLARRRACPCRRPPARGTQAG